MQNNIFLNKKKNRKLSIFFSFKLKYFQLIKLSFKLSIFYVGIDEGTPINTFLIKIVCCWSKNRILFSH